MILQHALLNHMRMDIFIFAGSVWKLPAVRSLRPVDHTAIKWTGSYILCSQADRCIVLTNDKSVLSKYNIASISSCRLRLEATLTVCLFYSLISWLLSFTYLLFISHRDLDLTSLYRDNLNIYIRDKTKQTNNTNSTGKSSASVYIKCVK